MVAHRLTEEAAAELAALGTVHGADDEDCPYCRKLEELVARGLATPFDPRDPGSSSRNDRAILTVTAV